METIRLLNNNPGSSYNEVILWLRRKGYSVHYAEIVSKHPAHRMEEGEVCKYSFFTENYAGVDHVIKVVVSKDTLEIGKIKHKNIRKKKSCYFLSRWEVMDADNLCAYIYAADFSIEKPVDMVTQSLIDNQITLNSGKQLSDYGL